MNGLVVWITGLPGSGKSTVADEIKQEHPDFVILRMDDLRKVVTPNPTYSDDEREMVYRSMVYTAKALSGLGHAVIIDATGNKRRWREFARQIIPSFVEIYLRCSLEECRKREEKRDETHSAPKAIYEKGEAGWPVPGVNVPYEEPLQPEVVVDTSVVPLKDTVALILDFLKTRPPQGKAVSSSSEV
jgi:adenylylsulfate kinase